MCSSLLSAQVVKVKPVEPVKAPSQVEPVTVDMSSPMGPSSVRKIQRPSAVHNPSPVKKESTAKSNTNGTNSTQYTPGANYAEKQSGQTKAAPAASAPSAAQNQTISDAGKDILNRLGSVTATDLASLSSQGLVPDVGSLLGNTLLTGQTSQNNDRLLTQILTELNEIKANQKNLTAPDVSKLKPANEPPAILRFVINSNDVLKSCNAVYFSNVEADGSFLLTGDCKSIYGNVVLEETFYMLFKSSGTKEGRTIYSVEISLSQKRENKNSLLYKFSEQENISAQRTGNLIIVRKNDPTFKSDMLLDIGK